jgi:5-methylcytosine-specific restriction endonuclease McrA
MLFSRTGGVGSKNDPRGQASVVATPPDIHFPLNRDCVGCGLSLPLSSFYVAKSGKPFGRRCRECYNKHQWTKVKEDPDQYQRRLARNLRFKEKHKQDLLVENRAWYAANKVKQKAAVKRWIKANPERWRALQTARRGRERGAGITSARISELLVSQKNRCVVCRCDLSAGYHVDHVIPLALGGAHEDWNIQLLCPTCNTSKGAKHPVAFMQSRGFLL